MALSFRLPCRCQRGCGGDGMGSILYIRSFDVHSVTSELSETVRSHLSPGYNPDSYVSMKKDETA
jgi:hypothetical protein